MKNIIFILIITITTGLAVYAQSSMHNSPVTGFVVMTTTAIKPLTITPALSPDYLYWPTVPVGAKYIMNSSPDQDADWKSIFTIKGEPGYQVQISIAKQTLIDEVEISYGVKGTDMQYLGNPPPVPPLIFTDGGIVVNLSPVGAYYIHLAYEWIWAKPGATPGERNFVQLINVCYHGL